MASRRKRASHRSNTGCLILAIGLIVLVAIFAIKLPEIKAILEKTKFLDLVKEKAASTTTLQEPNPSPPSTEETIPVPVTTTIPPTTSSPAAMRQSSLFFVKIEEDGVISRREVKRTIPASDSPLTDAVNALLAGPSEGEIRSGLVSLIPRETKLLGITVRGSTAIVDLSEAFMYNHYGVEGYLAQLKQVVYTATAFPSVQDVQILVEGKQKDYLGGEGVYIGKPLSRNSF